MFLKLVALKDEDPIHTHIDCGGAVVMGVYPNDRSVFCRKCKEHSFFNDKGEIILVVLGDTYDKQGNLIEGN